MANFFKAKKASNRQPKTLELNTHSYNHDGNSIGYIDGKICFVQGALPEEQVKVQLTEDKAKVNKGRVVKIIKPSPLRIEAQCQHFSQCGGCQLQYASRQSQLELKQQAVESLFKRFANVDILPWQESLVAEPWQYRRVARIGVWFDKNRAEFTVGFRKNSAKQLTAIEHCPVLSNKFASIFSEFKVLLPQLSCGPFVTHLEVIAADNFSFIVVRHTRPLKTADKQKLKAFGERNGWFIVAEGEKQRFIGISDEQLPQPMYQLEKHQVELQFNIGDFIQVNAEINRQMVTRAIEWLDIQIEDNVLDLFCGIGNFSLPLARVCQSVVGIEGVDAMVARAQSNAQHNGIGNAEFYQADLSQDFSNSTAAWLQRAYSKVLLDPARAGAEAMMSQVALMKPQKVLYVSCDPLTIARDCGQLMTRGYRLRKIALMDMFSQTKHVEIMALFEPK